MAPWLRTYWSYQGRECSTRPCHGSGYAHSALEHSQLTYGDAIGMSGMQLLRCWYCAIPGLVRPPLPCLGIENLYCRPFYSAGSGLRARPRDFQNRFLNVVLANFVTFSSAAEQTPTALLADGQRDSFETAPNSYRSSTSPRAFFNNGRARLGGLHSNAWNT